MHINYYNSVQVTVEAPAKAKEKPFSLTNTLYNWGDKLSKSSNMYNGKSYILILNNWMYDLTKDAKFEGQTQKYSFFQKVSAVAGYCLKKLAASFNGEIKARHLFAQELGKKDPDYDAVAKYITIIDRSAIVQPESSSKKTNGEGRGPSQNEECCFLLCECCVECCQCCAELCKNVK